MDLLAHHREHLHASAITDETIDRLGFRSETSTEAIRRMLNRRRQDVSAPALVIPFYHLDGSRNGFARIRPDTPRIDRKRNREIKYEQPVGEPNRVYFHPDAARAASTPRAMLGFTEGEKKSIASTQAGLPCLGLTGVFNWQEKREETDSKGRKTGPRILIPDLATIDWQDRPVWLCFDFDEHVNYQVELAKCELPRVLEEHGARVVVAHLPPGPRKPDGLPEKQGIDDFIVRFGGEAFRELIERATAPADPPRDLEDSREERRRRKVESVGHPGIYLDRGQTGVGKNHSDIDAAEEAETSLILVPTHRNAEELEEAFSARGLFAAAYPQINRKTCANYETAIACLDAGLPASSAVCSTCIFQHDCTYRLAMVDADAAAHRIACHHRGRLSLDRLAQGRAFVSVHEDSVAMLRPIEEAARGFDAVAEVAKTAGHTAWNREDLDGRHYFGRLEDTAEKIRELLGNADETHQVPMPPPVNPPRGADLQLFAAMREISKFPPGEAMRITKMVATGEADELVIRCDKVFARGRQTTTKRSVIAVSRTHLPSDVPCWFSDATADATEMQSLIGRPVIDATPAGSIRELHRVVQAPIDVTQQTSPKVLANILRGVMAAFPGRSVGILTHKRHVSVVLGKSRKASLGTDFQERIAKADYFRGGGSRGSNEWTEGCDLLVVCGTPRVPPPAIRTRRTDRPPGRRRPRWKMGVGPLVGT